MEPFLGTQVTIEQIRRVVTGYSADGESVIASDTRVAGSVGPRTFEFHRLWGADVMPACPNDGSLTLPDDFSWFPPPGGFRFARFLLPPNPTLTTALIDQSVDGMHKSQTVDLLYIESGQCYCKLGDGSKVKLTTGDTLVQNGTEHAWFNPFDEPCKIMVVAFGILEEPAKFTC